MQLFILCAPVWLRSSRFKKMRAPPTNLVRLRHSVSAEGRPTYSLSRRRYSRLNSGSSLHFSYSCATSFITGSKNSGIYDPPKSPYIPFDAKPAPLFLISVMIISPLLILLTLLFLITFPSSLIYLFKYRRNTVSENLPHRLSKNKKPRGLKHPSRLKNKKRGLKELIPFQSPCNHTEANRWAARATTSKNTF